VTGTWQHVRSLATEPLPVAPGPVGVTRLDVECNADLNAIALALASRWCEDRAVPASAAESVTALVVAAVGHGLRFAPRAVSIAIRWLDPDRVRVDLRWRDCSRATVSVVDNTALESTVAVFDALSDDWGFGGTGPDSTQWFVVDTRY
jgi:hypothetical protein